MGSLERTINHPSREAWLEYRQHGIGGSDVASILGLSPWKSPYALWAEKAQGVILDDESRMLRLGRRMEPLIAEEYYLETRRYVEIIPEWTTVTHPKLDYWFCTPDRYTGRPWGRDDVEEGVLELKSPQAFKRDEWLTNGVPAYYNVQVQAQMACTGLSWASFAILIGKRDFFWCDVERDDEMIDNLESAVKDFWRRVQEADPPPVDGADSTTDALKSLYPLETLESIVLPAEALEKDEERRALMRIITDTTKEKKALDNWFRNEIGDAELGIGPDFNYTLKTTTHKGYTVEETEIRTLRRKAKKT